VGFAPSALLVGPVGRSDQPGELLGPVLADHAQVAVDVAAHVHLATQSEELAEARSAQTRAEADKESVQRAADHDRATVQALRGQLEQQRQDHRRELETVRHEAHDERAALARQYADQIAAVLATVQQVGSHTQSTPATPKTSITTQGGRKNSRTKQA